MIEAILTRALAGGNGGSGGESGGGGLSGDYVIYEKVFSNANSISISEAEFGILEGCVCELTTDANGLKDLPLQGRLYKDADRWIINGLSYWFIFWFIFGFVGGQIGGTGSTPEMYVYSSNQMPEKLNGFGSKTSTLKFFVTPEQKEKLDAL